MGPRKFLKLFLFWPAILLAVCMGSVQAEQPEKATYQVTIEENGKAIEKTIHPDNAEEMKELGDWLQKGEVESLEKEKTPNLLTFAADLGIWTLVVFGLLYLILRKWAWKPMLEGLQRREQHIHDALAEAQKAREEAQRLREQYQRDVNQANDKVREIIDAGRRDAQRMTDEMVSKARAEIQAERDRLKREIEMAKDQALQELWNQTAHLATLVSSKAIRRQLTEEDHRRLVDEALAELSQGGHRG